MNPENDNKYFRVHKLALGIVSLVLIAGILGWWLGHSNSSSNPAPATATTSSNQSVATNDIPSSDVSALVKYVLPYGWKQVTCPQNKTTYVTPNGTTANCDSSPTAPIKLIVDANNTKDCNQLQNVTNVKKHICKSLYINGHKTLKASTEYQSMTVDTYYVDTGKGVVQLEYTHTDDPFQAGFDQLANSINVKG